MAYQTQGLLEGALNRVRREEAVTGRPYRAKLLDPILSGYYQTAEQAAQRAQAMDIQQQSLAAQNEAADKAARGAMVSGIVQTASAIPNAYLGYRLLSKELGMGAKEGITGGVDPTITTPMKGGQYSFGQTTPTPTTSDLSAGGQYGYTNQPIADNAYGFNLGGATAPSVGPTGTLAGSTASFAPSAAATGGGLLGGSTAGFTGVSSFGAQGAGVAGGAQGAAAGSLAGSNAAFTGLSAPSSLGAGAAGLEAGATGAGAGLGASSVLGPAGAGLAGGMVGSQLGSKYIPEKLVGSPDAREAIGGAAGGAATGAAVGAMFGGVGAVPGALIGGAIGLASSFIDDIF